MRRLSKIDDKLNVYKDKKIILFGASSAGKKIRQELLSEGINIYQYCDNCKEKWGTTIDGKQIISPKELLDSYNENTLIQISSEYDTEIIEQLKSMNIYNFISYAEYIARTDNLKFYRLKQKRRNLYEKYIVFHTNYEGSHWIYNIWNYFANVLSQSPKEPIYILSLPPKTGDWTLNSTLKNYDINYINFWHTFRYMDPELRKILKNRKIKIISAVRDPISQNISEFFQICFCYWDDENFWTDGGDYQILFDKFIHMELSNEFEKDSELSYIQVRKHNLKRSFAIQNFFEQQINPYIGLNLFDFPFNTDKGYDIVIKDNMEIFIYQLERLNDIKEQLGNFIGITNLKLQIENDGKNKWYALAYEDAKKNLIFSKEYLEYCYNCNYTKHFYSELDREKFKEKWKKHII